jgi:hypothetical protein
MVTIVLSFPINAYAYIDPGSVSFVLQVLAAAFVSVLVFWRGLLEKIKGFFKKPKKSTDNDKNE